VRQVEIGSCSGEEARYVEYLEKLVAAMGLPLTRSPVAGSPGNLIVGCTDRPLLAFVAHLDTIRPAWEWPGRAEVRGDEVWGLGSADDKGGVVAGLLGLLQARAAGVPVGQLPVALGLTVDEEEGGSGSLALAASLRPRHAVVLEPTGLRLATAEAGTVELRLRVHGKSAHGSLPEEGENAINKAARLVLELEELPFLRRPDPLIAPAAVLLQLHAGSELHVIPDLAEIHIDVRFGPALSVATVESQLRDLAARYGADVEPIELAEPWSTSRDAPLVRAMREAVTKTTGEEATPIASPAWTDAHNLVEIAASETVVFGPGDGRLAHRPDERIDARQVVACARVFAELLKQLWQRAPSWP
jgi:acetylornithine deacetylase/succinyl-diaminopimelate desuccinylase-like protein